MVIIHDNPPNAQSNPDGVLNWNAIADCRYLLKEPYAAPEAYPGFCLALSPMSTPLTVYQAANGTVVPLDKKALAMTAKSIKQQYVKQKTYPGLLSVGAQEIDLLVNSWKDVAAAGITSVFCRVSSRLHDVLKPCRRSPPSWSPWFSADGKGEKFLDIVYDDGAGRPLLEVDKFFISLNKSLPNP